MTTSDTDVGSGRWQPERIAGQQAELSRFLDQAAAHPFLREVASAALQLLELQPGARVLEVGCGNGNFLPVLAAAVSPSGRVIGIDHAPTFVEEARSRIERAGLAGRVGVQPGDALALPFDDASFDAAHCERVLMHLEDPNAALREMARVVRPGGWISAAEPDWAGYRVDHADREAMDLLFPRALHFRQADAGLTLYRRMGEVGLVERRARPMTLGITASPCSRSPGWRRCGRSPSDWWPRVGSSPRVPRLCWQGSTPRSPPAASTARLSCTWRPAAYRPDDERRRVPQRRSTSAIAATIAAIAA